MSQENYFAVSSILISTSGPLSHDIYINSSVLKEKERFVRVYPQGQLLSPEDLVLFCEKYHQLYVPEHQRGLYLKSLCAQSGRTVQDKTRVLKDSAIHHLTHLFDPSQPASSRTRPVILNDSIKGCRDAVEGFVKTLQNYKIEKVQELIGSLSFHDFYTYDHSINVAMYSIVVYQLIHPEATERELIQIGMGGLLHDVGKIMLPMEIINNSGKLTPDQFEQIKLHPDFGRELLRQPDIQLPHDVDAAVIRYIVHEHHENYDGTGYPQGLAGEKINEHARIVAIADFFDATTTKRSYHEALTTDEAVALMKQTRGKKLDPSLFDRFVQFMSRHGAGHEAGVCEFHLAGDFDPCQPRCAPFKDESFGKIIVK